MTAREKPLESLLAALNGAQVYGDRAVTVTGISADTRSMAPGELFVALPGDHTDGAAFAAAAAAGGASAVVTERTDLGTLPVPVVTVPDARRALSRLAASFWDEPSRELRVVGVTGTDGKTTTVFLISAVLEAGGYATGFVSTVDRKVGAVQRPTAGHVTTPQPPALHAALREMVDQGVQYAVVESSSHGLRLARLEDVAYDVAVLTNVTSEHLELHGTVEQYRLDKARLFSMLGRYPDKGVGKTGVVNADDPSADLFIRSTAGAVLTYGTYRHADVVGHHVRQNAASIEMDVATPAGPIHLSLPLVGMYNAYNALAALAVGLSQGVSVEDCRRGLESFQGVPGRMQRIDAGQPFGVIVDYAHTAESLGKVLQAVRGGVTGRVIAVFGSAGERDPTKRRPMGLAAGKLADLVYLADEDPRGEEPTAILEDIAEGLEAAGRRRNVEYWLIPDRREAIAAAFGSAAPGDLVLLLGKGHETSIEYADRHLPWNEAEVARELLSASG